MKKLFTSTLVLMLLSAVSAFAQPLSGVYYVPGPGAATLAAMVTRLNLNGVSGPTVIRITADQTAPSGGYVLGSSILNPTLNATNTLTFVGSNFSTTDIYRTLFAQSGSGNNDAIFTVQGANYVTFRKVNLEEVATNTTNTSMMERGYSIVKYNKDTGTKKTSIVDCSITLNNANSTAISGIAPYGATGIFIGNCTYLSNTALPLAVSEDGTNDGAFISACVIRNVNNGIYHAGIATIGDGTSYNDKNLTIVSDTIENFTHYGISISYSNSDLVSGNYINNTASGGTAPTSNNIMGVRYANNYPVSLQTNNSWDCYNNNINLTINSASTYSAIGIYSQIYGIGNTTIDGDTIQLTSSGNSAMLCGIFSQNQLGNQRIASCLVRKFVTQSTNLQPVIGIFVGGYEITPGLGITNTLSSARLSNVVGNTIDDFSVCSGGGSNLVYGIKEENLADSATVNYLNNTISNINLINNSGLCIGIGGVYSQASGNYKLTNITGSKVSNIYATGATNTTQILIYRNLGPTYQNVSRPNRHNLNFTKNNTSNIRTILGLVSAYAIDMGQSASIVSDTVSKVSSDSLQAFGVVAGLLTNATNSISVTGSIFSGIANNSYTSGAFVSGIHIQPGSATGGITQSVNIAGNLIQGVSSSDTLGSAYGISSSGGAAAFSISNNMISDIAATKDTSLFNSSVGINLLTAGTCNVFYNTVRMVSATTAASGYGATGIRFNTSGTNTIQNNILHVNVQAGSLNNVSAIRASSGSASAPPSGTAFKASSNIYFSPTGPNNFLFVSGTTNAGLVNGYHQSGLTESAPRNIVNDTFFNSECDKSSYHKFMKTGAATREVNTFTENNLTGTSGIYAPSGMSYAEAAGTDVAVSIDLLATPRPSGASDIGALEFAGTTRPQMLITITSSTGFDTACTFKLPTLSGTIPAFFNRVSYQWYRDTTKIVGATASSTVVSPISGNYILKVYDSITGCEYPSDPFRITIVPPPPAQITYYDSLTFCETSAVVLQGNKGYNYVYRWFKNGIAIPGETNDHLVVSTSGDFTLEVNTPLGCETVSTAIRTKVYPLPNPTISWISPTELATEKYYLYQWYKNNVKIDSFAQNRTFSTIYTGDGAYSVEVTDSNGCTSKSNVFLYSTSINDQSKVAATIKVFPNPATSVVNIESSISVSAKLTDLTGRVVFEANEAKTINVSSLSSGIYLISLSDTNGNLIKVEKINVLK